MFVRDQSNGLLHATQCPQDKVDQDGYAYDGYAYDDAATTAAPEPPVMIGDGVEAHVVLGKGLDPAAAERCTVLTWSDTEITCTVPELASGSAGACRA